MRRRLPSSFTSPLPDRVRRPLAPVLLFTVSGGLGWAAHAAGWPREQVLIVGILAATVLLWMTEALPLFATAFISALTASLSMALPVSTPPNAMAYASGQLTTRDFLRTAGVIGGVGAALIVAVLVLAG